jgi:hypothetical protein
MRDYKYEGVHCKGKQYTFTVRNAKDFSDSKRKAVNWLIKSLNLPQSDFNQQLGYLSNNIENCYTLVKPVIQKQLDLDLSSKSSKFNDTFEKLYSGILSEDGCG